MDKKSGSELDESADRFVHDASLAEPGATAAPAPRTLRERVYSHLFPAESSKVDNAITGLIIVNIMMVLVEAEGSLAEGNETFFYVFELISTAIFTVEYVLRCWIIPLHPKYAHLGPVLGRLRYMVSFMALVDVVAIAPFYLSFIQMDLRAARALRLLRLLRLLKVLRSESFRMALHRKLNPEEGTSNIDTFIILLIAVNVVAVIFETEPAIAEEYANFFRLFEFFSTLVFTAEYLTRVWLADLDPKYAHLGPVKSRLRFIFSIMAMVDLIAILPFYLRFVKMDMRIARAIRLMRLVRILKVGRYAHAVTILNKVILRKKEELAISTFISVMVLILCSSAMYFVEHTTQPEAFGSIPRTMWWAVVTLTSVGYGDVSPQSPGGMVLGAVICLIGVLLVALPTGILASGFAEEIRERKGEGGESIFGFCPHCGEKLNPLLED